MPLISGELLRWGRECVHVDNEYFTAGTDFGFGGATAVPVMREHEHGYVFKHPASILRATDGLLFVHWIDPTRPEEAAVLALVEAGQMRLSPGPFAPGELGGRAAGIHKPRPATPQPIRWYPLKEASYTTRPAQKYLRPCEIIMR